MTKVIQLTRYPDRMVLVNPDTITYITDLEVGPCKTRIYFDGDRANSIDVIEDIHEVAKKIFICGVITPTYSFTLPEEQDYEDNTLASKTTT